jgi:outer membrane protein assembly factor BamB
LSPSNPWGKDVVGAWLVKIAADGTISKVAFSALTPNAPAASAPCSVQFPNSDLPWPPSPDAVPPTTPCGSQRPGVNVAPAVAPDGTIYTISRTHFATRYGFLVAVNPNLTLKWAASLRGHLTDGCGVPVSEGGQLPPNGAPGGCRVGAHPGVDPGTNELGPGRVLDDSTSSPVVAPDGSVFYGAYTAYNYLQGHMLHFDANGNFLNFFRFGWDITPAIYSHGGTYSVITKDNHYGTGSYCGVEAFCPEDRTAENSNGYPEAYFVSSLSPSLTLEWSFQNTNTLSCTRQPDGSVTCVSDHPRGFEWCVNAPAVDSHGVTYANSEDGNMFALNPDGTLKKKIFQQLAIGAAYTPASLGADGKIYSQNDGHLYVVGNNQ